MIYVLLRMLCAAFIAGFVGFSFRRSWRVEHGKEDDSLFVNNDSSKNVSVLCSADSLIWILPMIAILFIVIRGVDEGVDLSIVLLADVMIIYSLYCPLLYLVMPLLRKRISARACALLWIAPVFLFYNFNLLFCVQIVPAFQFYIPKNVMFLVLAVWFAGFAGIFGFKFLKHCIFLRHLSQNSYPVTNEITLSVWRATQEELEYYPKEINLRQSPMVNGPFSIAAFGWGECTVLPEKPYTVKELHMIFSHELHHLQRDDVSTKWFMNFLTALCWFNPLIWLAARKAVEDLELSCDEIVAADMTEAERRSYAGLLLDNTMPQQAFTTCLSASAGVLRYRMGNIVKPRKVKSGILVLVAATFTCFMCYGLLSFSMEQTTAGELLSSMKFKSLLADVDLNLEDANDSRMQVVENQEEIYNLLDRIEVQKLYGIRDFNSMDDTKSMYVCNAEEGLSGIYLYQDMLILQDEDMDRTYYKVVSSVDWNQLSDAVNY